ncbi:MAG: addiction module toxin, HicA family [Deltaproteobacteria bacterium]|nr:addiction module toxin, HicA family [Deltaproteobacteria bacterium]
MKTVSGKDFARLLEKHGWELKRVTGSHHVYAKFENPARISVPVHGNASLKIALLKHLLKLSGISENEL